MTRKLNSQEDDKHEMAGPWILGFINVSDLRCSALNSCAVGWRSRYTGVRCKLPIWTTLLSLIYCTSPHSALTRSSFAFLTSESHSSRVSHPSYIDRPSFGKATTAHVKRQRRRRQAAPSNTTKRRRKRSAPRILLGRHRANQRDNMNTRNPIPRRGISSHKTFAYTPVY